MIKNLIQKYNISGPRYTSYPTVPYWENDSLTEEQWRLSLLHSFTESNSQGISIYIHLPFCENLCTFCGCHKRITKRHAVERPYIDSVLKEWKLYCDFLPSVPKIKEIHLGGGTPTFFNASNLKRLINGITDKAEMCENFEFSLEGHPNNTSAEQMTVLYDLGFRRISFGVQDYDPIVQKVINRIQPFEQVKKVHELAKTVGYTSISHDLVFGLPRQTIESIENTIEKTNHLRPDRISFYSYAHVPWIKGLGQRGYDENDLPKEAEKRKLYEIGKQLLDQNGYVEIGMDHFALPHDLLYKAMKNNTLHRNFMGYTTNNTQAMIGLGMSAISDSWYGFAQNVKTVEEYQDLVEKGQIPVFRGHLLNEEDLEIRRHILNLMCHFETSWDFNDLFSTFAETIKSRLIPMEQDGLVKISKTSISVTPQGRPFVRNCCMAFDQRLHRKLPTTRLFSMTV